MKVINHKFNIEDKDSIISKYNVRPVRGVKRINEHCDSVYVSSKGDVLTFNKYRNLYPTYCYWSNEELRATDKFGYIIFNLRHYDLDGNKEHTVVKLHRLVACTYLTNPNNLRDVDHIDCDKNNNDVSNLEWVTHAENCKRYWNKHMKSQDRLYYECCGSNMNVHVVITLGDKKVRYRKCAHCGKSIKTIQYDGYREIID